MVVDAYEQLIAQGFLLSRPRQVPVVRAGETPKPAPRYRFALSPNAPDLSRFPRRLWLRATAEAMRELPDTELDYPADARGACIFVPHWLATYRGSAGCGSTSTT